MRPCYLSATMLFYDRHDWYVSAQFLAVFFFNPEWANRFYHDTPVWRPMSRTHPHVYMRYTRRFHVPTFVILSDTMNMHSNQNSNRRGGKWQEMLHLYESVTSNLQAVLALMCLAHSATLSDSRMRKCSALYSCFESSQLYCMNLSQATCNQLYESVTSNMQTVLAVMRWHTRYLTAIHACVMFCLVLLFRKHAAHALPGNRTVFAISVYISMHQSAALLSQDSCAHACVDHVFYMLAKHDVCCTC